MDATIGLRQLAIDCIIGAYAQERGAPQRIYVDVALEVDVERVLMTDDLSDVVDYTAVAELLIELAKSRQFRLLEVYAATAADAILVTFPGARGVDLEVRKPESVERADHAFVRLRRERSSTV